jgi:PIN domain nuclease of toxin-antitoxin system
MRILLDTHLLYWALFQPRNIARPVQEELEDAVNVVLFSAVNVWEIAIKTAIGRAGFDVDVGEIASVAVESGFRELPVFSSAAARVATLPMHHSDPFDRLLVAQAMAEEALLYTRDARLEQYSDLVRLV